MFERYYHELMHFCFRAVKDRHAAADLVQESYARVLAMHRSGQAILEPRALLYQIARRLIIDRHRRLELRDHEDLAGLSETEQPALPQHLQPESVYASAQLAQAMVAAIESLPPRCREAFVLNRFEALSHEEVAERMGISRNMVAQHITRAVQVCKSCAEGCNGVA